MTIQQQLEAADLARARGDEPTALAGFLAAALLARAAFAPALEGRAMLSAGELRHVAGDAAGAREALEEAVARAMEGGDRLVEGDAWYALATVAFDAGRSKDGHDALLEAMALYRELDGREPQRRLARAVRLYGEHLGVLGGAAEARQALELAKAMFSDLGEAEAARGVDEDLAQLDGFSR